MEKIYPFKFLDAYSREDARFFFGRDEEIEQMYQMIFQSDILLVYGASGTGKSSLIQSGLAGRFQSTDWLALNVRRGNDINASLQNELTRAGGNVAGQDNDKLARLVAKLQGGARSEQLSALARTFKNIYLNSFRPIYLIFDQFEELYILGTKDEQRQFIQTVQEILKLEQQVKMIFSIREEYLGHLFEFEKAVPQLMRKKLRVEPMNLDKVRSVMDGVTRLEGSMISMKAGEEQTITEAVFNKIKGGDNTLTIQLPYLQVFLDKLYYETTHDNTHRADAVFALDTINKMGDIGDILRDFLDEQVKVISRQLSRKDRQLTPDDVWDILSPFATLEGTKKPISLLGLLKELPQYDNALVTAALSAFVDGRILRSNERGDLYELVHDTLAKKVAENRSDEEVELLSAKKLVTQKIDEQELLNEKQLARVEACGDKLVKMLDESEIALVANSSKVIKENIRKHKRRIRLTYASLVVGILILGTGFLWAIKQSRKAEEETLRSTSLLLSTKAFPELQRGNLTKAFRFGQYAYEANPNNIDGHIAIYSSVFQCNDSVRQYWCKASAEIPQYICAVLSPDQTKMFFLDYESNPKMLDIATGNVLYSLPMDPTNSLSASFSCDGSMLITSGAETSIWRADSGKMLRTLVRETGAITSAAFAHDNKTVVTTSSDTAISIWDITSGKVINEFRGEGKSVVFSPDGNKILTSSSSEAFNVSILYDAKTGKEISRLLGAEAIFSPDGKKIVTTVNMDDESRLNIYDTNGYGLMTLKGHKNFIYSFAFSPDGSKIVTTSDNRTAKVWETSTGRELGTLTGHTDIVDLAIFSRDNKNLLTVSRDRTMRIWDITSDMPFSMSLKQSVFEKPVFFSPDSKKVATGGYDTIARIWDAATGLELLKLLGHRAKVNSIRFSPGGERVITASDDSTSIIWDAEHGNKLHTLKGHGKITFAVFSPDGTKAVTLYEFDSTVTIWDTENGNKLHVLTGHDYINFVVFSPDAKKIVSNNGTIWDILTGKNLVELSWQGSLNECYDNVFSPDSKKIIASTQGGGASIFDVSTGQRLQWLDDGSATFSPDYKIIVTSTGKFLNASTAKCVVKIVGETNERFSRPVFSMDGHNVLTCSGNTISVWDATTGQRLLTVSHKWDVLTGSFSPDGKRIVSVSNDAIKISLLYIPDIITLLNDKIEDFSLFEKRKYYINIP